MAVHEILPVSEEMTRSIINGASADILRQQATASGFRPMQEDAFDRVQKGQTTFEEARRLIFFDANSLEGDIDPVAKAS
jgi:type II secretory ATPase GspE/PulE/Tfp pilus assembly ATPase PilB-like protein